MTKGQKVDRLALHERFWERMDRFGKIEIYQKGLAEELNLTTPTMSIIMKEVVGEGRIKKIASKRRNVGVYTVRDPARFEHVFIPFYVPGIDVERCERCGELFSNGQHTLNIL